MNRSSLEVIALDWMRFWQGGDLAEFDRVHAPSFIDRSAANRPADRLAFREAVAALYRAFPDFAATVEFLAIDEIRRLVTIRWSAVGHMHGPFLDAEPAGQRVSFHGIEVIAICDGLVTERWGEWDEDEIQAQISGPSPAA